MAVGRTKKTRGRKAAQELKARLSGEEFRERVQFTEDEMRVLDRICTGKYVRNASAITASFRLRSEYAYAKPQQGFDITSRVDTGDISDEEWALLAEIRHKKQAQPDG